MKNLIIGFVAGIFIPYIISILDIILQYIGNKQSLSATKVQIKINELSQQYEEQQPCIGFHVQDEEDMIYEEDDEEK